MAKLTNIQSGAKTPQGPDVQNCFYDFCKQTILHGWHYLADLVRIKEQKKMMLNQKKNPVKNHVKF